MRSAMLVTTLHACMHVLALDILISTVCSQAGAVAYDNHIYASSPTLTSTTTAPLERLLPNCSDVAWCVVNSTCNACLTAVLPYILGSISGPDRAEIEGRFLEVLKSTPSCSPTLLTPARFANTLDDIAFNMSCRAIVGIDTIYLGSMCQQYEYKCFVDANCSACLSDLYTPPANRTARLPELFESPTCAVSGGFLEDLFKTCNRFPSCSFSKFKCSQSTTCSSCWAQLEQGEGAAAASNCRSLSGIGSELDYLAGKCMTGTQVSCDYFVQVCSDMPFCGDCLAELGSFDSDDGTAAIVRGMSTPACVNYALDQQRHNGGVGPSLTNVIRNCPQHTLCQEATVFCGISEFPSCVECLNGSAPVDSQLCTSFLSAGRHVTAAVPPHT
jgi:hypothetical protein